MGSIISTAVFIYTVAHSTLKYTGAFANDSDFGDCLIGCGITAMAVGVALAIASTDISFSISCSTYS